MVNAARKLPPRKGEPAIERNFGYFYKRDWKQTEKKGKTVYNVSVGKVSPTVETLQLVADRARIPDWYLLIPAPIEVLESLDLSKLVNAYIKADPEGRKYILKAAELTSK